MPKALGMPSVMAPWHSAVKTEVTDTFEAQGFLGKGAVGRISLHFVGGGFILCFPLKSSETVLRQILVHVVEFKTASGPVKFRDVCVRGRRERHMEAR